MLEKINVNDIVDKLYPKPIHDDFSEGIEFDARQLLRDALQSYHEALVEAPEEIRPKIARAMLDGLSLGVNVTLSVYYKNSNIPEKLFELVDEYNKIAEIPSLESNVRED